MVDFEQVVAIAKSRGTNQKELAKLLGISTGHLWRLKTGKNRPSDSLLLRTLDVLGLSPADIGVAGASRWTCFPKTRSDLLTTFHEQLRNAESVLTLTNCVDSYLQDEWMLEWSNHRWLNIEGWEEHKSLFLPYAREQTVSRERSGFWHRLVCPYTLFVRAKSECIDWLDCVRRGFGKYEGMTAVTLVPEWGRFHSEVSRYLPQDAQRWDKICIVDSVVAMIHLEQYFYMVCYNEHVIRDLKRAIDHVASQEALAFLRESRVSGTKMRDVAHDTEDELESILRDKIDLDRSRPCHLAFVRYTVEGTCVPPAKYLAGNRPPKSRHAYRHFGSIEP